MACVGGVAGLDVVIEDDPVGVVAHVCAFAELDRLPEHTFPVRTGSGVVQTNPAGGAVGVVPAGRCRVWAAIRRVASKFDQVVYGTDQPATSAAAASAFAFRMARFA